MTDTPAFPRPATGRYFIKMHGLRNHFVIVDGREEAFRPAREDIVRICDPQTGVGGDQLIILEAPTADGMAAGAIAFMRILNVDGVEAEACGNATRCVAWLLLEELDTDELIVETVAGLIDCRRTGELEVACTMGRVSTDWQIRRLPSEKACLSRFAASPASIELASKTFSSTASFRASIAMWEATSPAACPPIPSQTMCSPSSGRIKR